MPQFLVDIKAKVQVKADDADAAEIVATDSAAWLDTMDVQVNGDPEEIEEE